MNDVMNKWFSLPRLKIGSDLSLQNAIELDKKQSHYLLNVLRLQAGDFCRVFNAGDGEFLAKIDKRGKTALLIPEKQIRKPEDNFVKTVLVFSPVKKPRLQFLIEKAVELGATHFLPVICERTVLRKLDTGKLQAWIDEALEQSERLSDPVLMPPRTLLEVAGGWQGICEKTLGSYVPLYACIEREKRQGLAQVFEGGDCAFLIGPEGGFSSSEIEAISNNSELTGVSLGPAVLRSETAVMSCLSFAMIARCNYSDT